MRNGGLNVILVLAGQPGRRARKVMLFGVSPKAHRAAFRVQSCIETRL